MKQRRGSLGRKVLCGGDIPVGKDCWRGGQGGRGAGNMRGAWLELGILAMEVMGQVYHSDKPIPCPGELHDH